MTDDRIEILRKACKSLRANQNLTDADLTAIGAKGERGERGESFRWRGKAAPRGAYEPLDCVRDGSTVWVCTKAAFGAPVRGDSWEELVVSPQGAQGERGERGSTGAKGEQGERGSKGDEGKQGARGITGKQGEVGVTWRGNFSAGESYAAGDIVSSNGSIYLATEATSQDVDGFGWVLFSRRGSQGATGLRGEQGDIRGTSGVIQTSNTTASSSSSTGAMIIAGGAGIAKDSWINGVRVGTGQGSQPQSTAVGAYAVGATNTGLYVTALGYGACGSNSSGSHNTGVGGYALNSNTVSNCNTAVGLSALRYNTAADNTAVGFFALEKNTLGANNVALGKMCLSSNVVGSYNTGVGLNSLTASTGDGNVAVGCFTLSALVGTQNVAVGYSSGTNLAGADNYNVFVGAFAGRFYSASSSLTAASHCVFVGYNARPNANTPTNQTIIGYNALGIGGDNSTTINSVTSTLTTVNGTSTSVLATVGDTVRIENQKTPASAAATGTKGDICHDTDFLYVCIATNTWKRVALSAW